MTHEEQQKPQFARRLGLFDATMLVMGGIIGSGIFMNPHVVATIVHTPLLILGAWAFGGLIALAGAFIYAELAARKPEVGGQYAYIREAYHPLLAFLFGWGLFLVSTSGGLAAVAMTFARYFIELTGTSLPDWSIAITALALFTALNCLGVRTGGTIQSTLMVMKIAAIAFLVFSGYLLVTDSKLSFTPLIDQSVSLDLLTSFGAALVPVMFAFGGWQTANFIAAEIKEPEKNLPRGLLIGVIGVVALYLCVNLVSLHALGAARLAHASAPASEVMRIALGERGAMIIALGIAISTLGFLSQGILTAPRVYYAMARDGLFFRSVASLHPKTHVPVVAIVLQGIFAMLVTLSGTYEQILSYVVSDDFIFFGLSASCIFMFRRRDSNAQQPFLMPGHPYTTALFILVSLAVVINTVYKYPINTLIGIAVLLTGIPVYYYWRKKHQQ